MIEHFTNYWRRTDGKSGWLVEEFATRQAAIEDAGESPITPRLGADYGWEYDHTVHAEIWTAFHYRFAVHWWSPELIRDDQRIERRREQAAATPGVL